MLIRSGAIVAFFTMLSRIFGMLRELFIASTFGTGPIADSVNVAFKLPNLFRRIFGEGALASIFVPMFSEKLTSSKENAERFAGKVFLLLTLVLIAFTGLMQYFMPELMVILAPGFGVDGAKFELTVLLCRITMPYLLFISLSALVGGMLNSVGRFAAFAFSPVLMNMAVIFGTTWISEYIDTAHAIGWSVVLAGVLQLTFIAIAAHRASLGLRAPHVSPDDKDIKKLLKLMIPATISSGVTQVNMFISQSISSFIPGAVSILSYADRLYQLPMSVIGVTFGTILLPTLSKLYKLGKMEEAEKTQELSIKIGLLLSLPCSVVLIVLAHPIIQLIYEHGAFTPEDTIKTGNTIAAFSIGLPAFVLGKIFTPIFYANLDAATPMRVTIYTIIANIILNLIFMQFFSHVGIAIGSSLAAWFNVWLFMRYAKSNGFFHIRRELLVYIAKLLLNSFVCGLSIWFIYRFSASNLGSSEVIYQAINVFGSIFLGFAIYIICSFLTGIVNKDLFTKLIKKELSNAK